MNRRSFVKSSLLLSTGFISIKTSASSVPAQQPSVNPIKGQKFSPNGKAEKYKGCTIICNTNKSSDLFASMLKIQVKIQRDFGDVIVLLPPDSYHMTVMELTSGEAKKPWPHNTPFDLSQKEVTETIKKMLIGKNLGFTEEVTMQIDFKRHLSLPEKWNEKKQPALIIPLKPQTNHDQEILRKFRDTIASITGVRKKNHDNYFFHTTFGYQLKPMSANNYKEFKVEYKKWLSYLHEKSTPITFSNPLLCYFEDMLEFKPVLQLNN
ncbi:DUF1868 domain-containing protein [Salmonella enterica]|nr:DUF1868 domain-containing protein [Salmonella enterica]